MRQGLGMPLVCGANAKKLVETRRSKWIGRLRHASVALFVFVLFSSSLWRAALYALLSLALTIAGLQYENG